MARILPRPSPQLHPSYQGDGCPCLSHHQSHEDPRKHSQRNVSCTNSAADHLDHHPSTHVWVPTLVGRTIQQVQHSSHSASSEWSPSLDMPSLQNNAHICPPTYQPHPTYRPHHPQNLLFHIHLTTSPSTKLSGYPENPTKAKANPPLTLSSQSLVYPQNTYGRNAPPTTHRNDDQRNIHPIPQSYP